MAYNGYIQIVQPSCAAEVREAEKKAGRKFSEAERQKLQRECEQRWIDKENERIQSGGWISDIFGGIPLPWLIAGGLGLALVVVLVTRK